MAVDVQRVNTNNKYTVSFYIYLFKKSIIS